MRLKIMCGRYLTAEKVEIKSRKSDATCDISMRYSCL